MSGWIKWEKDLEEDPRTLRMARELKRMCNAMPFHPVTVVCGGLLRLWRYADSHIRDDDTLDMGANEIDELVGIPGFCSIVPADWLRTVDDSTVELPGFQQHNGVEAKRKALTQKRVARHRDNAKRDSVTPALPDQTRPDQTIEREAHAPESTDAPRGTGVIPAGNRLTTSSAASAFESLLEDWKRDIPECDQEAFTRWIVHIETSGRRMGAEQRLYQARQLATNGDYAAQKEVVDFCIGKPYFSLIPIGDVRARTQGMTRGGGRGKPVAQSDAEALQKLKDRRSAIGLADFRDPQPCETADAYGKAQDAEFKRLDQQKNGAPRFAQALAAAKGMPA